MTTELSEASTQPTTATEPVVDKQMKAAQIHELRMAKKKAKWRMEQMANA